MQQLLHQQVLHAHRCMHSNPVELSAHLPRAPTRHSCCTGLCYEVIHQMQAALHRDATAQGAAIYCRCDPHARHTDVEP